ncbi:hypothetical protein G9A89_022997 [Geosiphon pyriformis]|nr:hypothetical protein G9A89_022997 [Geosiphon pyriformis]
MMSGGKELKIFATCLDLILLSILLYQVVVYMRRYKEDRLLLKSWIWTNTALELASTVVLILGIYYPEDWQVTDIVITSIIVFLCQIFLGFQAYLASNQKWPFIIGIGSASVFTFVAGIFSAIKIKNSAQAHISYITTIVFLSLSAGLDILLAVVFSYGFITGKKTFDPVAYRVMRILLFTMNLLALLAILDIITFAMMRSYSGVALVIHVISVKAYLLTVLWPINRRNKSASIICSDENPKNLKKNSIDVEPSRISVSSGYVYDGKINQLNAPASAYIAGSKSSTMTSANRLSQINLGATHAGYWASLNDDW